MTPYSKWEVRLDDIECVYFPEQSKHYLFMFDFQFLYIWIQHNTQTKKITEFPCF